MRKITKFLLLMAAMVLSSSLIIAQVNPAISVSNPKAKTELTKKAQNQTLQKEQIVEAKHGPTHIVPFAQPGGSRAVGDDCTDPIIVSIPAALPYSDANTTCGRLNDYTLTGSCMGSYTSGEDLIYRLDVTADVTLKLTLNPGTTTYGGMGIFDGCPDVGNCIAAVTSSTAAPKFFFVDLVAGNSYYVMIDTWSTPDCIPALTFTVNYPAPGDLCSTAISYGNVNGPSVSGTLVAGTSQWYTFTSSTDLMTSVSLCGSSFDSKLEIYNDCGASYVFYNDDYCGLQSQIDNIQVHAGEVWYARVYGYSTTSSGPYTLTITGTPPPANDNCTSAQVITGSYPQTISGTTINAFTDCPNDLGWNAVWYQIDLPYAVNTLDINYCGTVGTIPTVGIVYYNDCSDCGAYTIMDSYSFNACGDGYTNPDIKSLSIPGPATIYFPAYVGSTGMDFQFTVNVTSQGDLEGHVFNYDGLTISGATVRVDDLNWTTTTDASGYYSFQNVPAGPQSVSCGKAGYNPTTATVEILPAETVTQDFTLTQPNMIINPLTIEQEVNPNEYFTTALSVLNNGNGPLDWTAVIQYPEVDFPHYSNGSGAQITYGSVSNPLAFNRSSANDQVISTGTRDFGDILNQWPAPSPIGLVWGTANDGTNLWLTDPNLSATNIYQVTPDGAMTGTTYSVSQGQTWIGDMASDGDYLYCCLVGGDNSIAKVDLSNGSVVANITGAWTITSQRGLAYDAVNDEFYIGGWNSNEIWRVDGTGATISTTMFTGVSGLAWHPNGGPDGNGSLWVAANTATSNVTELDPNNGWATLQSFAMPGGTNYSSAGLALDPSGALWVPNQTVNTMYLVDLAEPLSGGGNWLTMDRYEGTVPAFGGVDNVPTHLDASGKNAGEVYTADIIFSSTPNVGTIDVPVTMIVIGPALNPPDNLNVELVNDVTGEVHLTWDWTGDSFQFFMIKRDGVIIGTTTAQHYTDILPDFGNYCYTVQAVYDEGQTAPAGPECIEWPNPTIFVNPANLEGWVWVNHTVDVYTTISNNGIGTLEYTFPAFAALDLINNPQIKKNMPGAPYDTRSLAVEKGKDTYANTGYPIVLGAGGPDSFGYVWIDSDETGGPVFNWMDISATGTEVTGLSDDNVVGPFPMGITFPFYGQDKSQFWINSNGTVGFTSNNIGLSNSGIPTGSTTNIDFIAWMWDDMDPGNALSHVYYQAFESYTVIQFSHYFIYPDGGAWLDAEMILYKNGKIQIQYNNLQTGLTTTSCTVGIQSSDPSLGLQVAYNTSYIHNGLALLFDLPADFIVAVNPATALVGQGGHQDVTITYDSEGYDPGDYTQDLMLESNDPTTPEFTIGNTMHVYTPAQYAGMVVDNDDDSPLAGVNVTAGPFNTTTGEDGTYSLFVDEGSYDVTFTKLGYQTMVVADTMAPMGVVTPVSVGMWDMNYPPAFVHAEVMDDDTWCQVTWALPAGPYEIIMDDGSADDLFLWQVRGSRNAVKFTPSGYPATVIGGNFYVGDGSYPGPFLGTEFGVAIYAADGANGLPGTLLDSTGVTVNNYGWVSVDWMNAEITEGDFYVAMIQTENAPHAAPLGVDMTNPTYYKSYSKYQDNDWSLSAYQDFMIRAWISGPEGDNIVADNNSSAKMMYPPKVSQAQFEKIAMSQSGVLPRLMPGTERSDVKYAGVESTATRNVVNYRVSRYSDFDPNGSPDAGTITELATTTDLSYNDYAWAGLDQGWYAYGVKAKYTSGDWSAYAISNIVAHMMDFQVTVNVTLSTGLEPSNVEITMQGTDYPYETYTDVTPASGQVIFPAVWKGHYSFSAYKIGYDEYTINNLYITADKVINVVLGEKKYAPSNLYVDPLTLEATWNEPLVTALVEDFEGPTFPPEGWQTSSLGQGWFRTNDGGSSYFTIPTWDSYYACDNDDAAGSGNDGSMDYLITPRLDLRESDGFAMSFNSYYDGGYGQLAFVEYSTDGGATWQVLYQLMPSTAWAQIELDLSSLSGSTGTPVWLAFHADDAGQYASGWAVDNPKVQVPAPAANYIDFYVFLDDAFVASTTETNYNLAPLNYGQEYTASVGARYTSGLSAKDYYTFTSVYLVPPRNLVGAAPDNAAILHWDEPVVSGGVFNLVSEQPRKEFPNVHSEYSPTVRTVEGGTATRAPWDLQFAFATADNSGEAGAESDGQYLYTSMWNGTGFQQYNLDGSYVGPLSAGSANGIRDLAYDDDNGHMYGGAATTTVDEMDFTAGTLVGTFSAPTDVRAIAYDPGFDGLWANNWSTNITLFDMTGTQLNSFPVGSYGNYYGFAYDGWTDGGPYLYGFSQDGSGNVIVQIEIATGQETGFTQDVSGLLITGAGIAGGLFTQPNIISGKVTIGGNSQNDVFFGYELADAGTQQGGTPPGLIGYNVYRDGDFVNYVVHPQTSYVDENLNPAIYAYTVTAVYDLASYGFPGETGESMEEGPAMVPVDYCYDLDFSETWALGNFDANNWTPSDANWSVNGQSGNPAPSAEFTWDPIQTDYSVGLESYPLCGVGMTEGTIWFDYDLKLASVNPTGEEMLDAQVWNWDSQTWTTVATYSNVDGNFDWMSEHQNIKAQAMNKVFKVRFLAHGTNSLDILGWNVDNIHVYRTCDAPSEMTASNEYNTASVVLNWTSPGGGAIAEWIHWDDGTNFDAIGTGAAAEFDVAARWEPAQLADYDGTSVTQVAFYPNEAAATYSIRIWKGAGAANLIVDQAVTNPVIGAWNYVTLDTPVPVDISQELWIGYYINTTTGYPAGTDAGPAIDGYGNMMNFGGWQTLLQINPALDYNWNIQGYLQTTTGAVVQLGSIPQEAHNVPAGASVNTAPGYVAKNPVFGGTNGSRILSGFNIYRSVEGGAYELHDFTSETTYTDGPDLANALYCYKVTAVYESETDLCESDFSNESCTILNVGINDPNAVAGFNLYPNPAIDHVNITSGNTMTRVTVYNSLGQLIKDEVVNTNNYELNTASYKAGVYMVRVQTDKGVTTRALTINR